MIQRRMQAVNINQESSSQQQSFNSGDERKNREDDDDDDEQYLGINQLKSTRRLLIQGNGGIDKFIQLLRKATSTPFKVESGQGGDHNSSSRKIVLFKSSVKTNLIQNVLQSSDNESLALLVSKSTSIKTSNDFLSSSSNSKSLSSQSSFQEENDDINFDLDYISQLILEHSEWQSLQQLLSYVRNSLKYNPLQQAKLWRLISQHKSDIQAIFNLCHEYQANQQISQVQAQQQQEQLNSQTYSMQQESLQQNQQNSNHKSQNTTVSSLGNNQQNNYPDKNNKNNNNNFHASRNSKAIDNHVMRIKSRSITPTKNNTNHTNE